MHCPILWSVAATGSVAFLCTYSALLIVSLCCLFSYSNFSDLAYKIHTYTYVMFIINQMLAFAPPPKKKMWKIFFVQKSCKILIYFLPQSSYKIRELYAYISGKNHVLSPKLTELLRLWEPSGQGIGPPSGLVHEKVHPCLLFVLFIKSSLEGTTDVRCIHHYFLDPNYFSALPPCVRRTSLYILVSPNLMCGS